MPSPAELIALAALIVSAMSAFFSWQAVKTSRERNKINLHQPRKEIYEAMFDFRRLFVDRDLHPSDEEIQHFYRKVVLPAHVYFSAEIVEKMYRIYEDSMGLYQGIVAASKVSTETKWELTNKLQEVGKADLDQLIAQVAKEMDLGDT